MSHGTGAWDLTKVLMVVFVVAAAVAGIVMFRDRLADDVDRRPPATSPCPYGYASDGACADPRDPRRQPPDTAVTVPQDGVAPSLTIAPPPTR